MDEPLDRAVDYVATLDGNKVKQTNLREDVGHRALSVGSAYCKKADRHSGGPRRLERKRFGVPACLRGEYPSNPIRGDPMLPSASLHFC